ncbi:hypothetical protein [Streptomyces sp. NPDC127084]|uniref:hypothetical protein n=1 Tax=Streptomyces sp. NPDC127084 TaxID=3347133 RepID=UPI00365087F6
MTDRITNPTPARAADKDIRTSWTRARLIEPSASGFVHIGASSGAWRTPVVLPRARRRKILDAMHVAAAELLSDPRVTRADVFEAFIRPPGRRPHGPGRDVPDADFDAVLLVETTDVHGAEEVLREATVTGLQAELDRTAQRSLVFAGSNARRIARVDHERQGVFLFNYFSADDVDTNLYAWQYTAGWFQDETGLDNSTVLQPTESGKAPYSLVNHCRWDHMSDVMPSLVFKPSFRKFVLRTFAEHRVAARPIFYRLHRAN